MSKKRPAGKRVGKKATRQPGNQATGELTPAEARRKEQLRELHEFPGMNLSKLYAGVVRQSRDMGESPNTPVYPNQVALLDQVGADILTKIHAEGDLLKTGNMVCKLMRAVQAAERDRVQRYACETALGAAAMQVDGVNQLNRIRQELRAEKKTKKTIETLSEG